MENDAEYGQKKKNDRKFLPSTTVHPTMDPEISVQPLSLPYGHENNLFWLGPSHAAVQPKTLLVSLTAGLFCLPRCAATVVDVKGVQDESILLVFLSVKQKLQAQQSDQFPTTILCFYSG